MSILCKMFGHQAPVYNPTGWFSPGEQYAKVGKTEVSSFAIDGTGREHASVHSECPRCGENFKVCRIHLPKRNSEKRLIRENDELKEALNISTGAGI